MKGTKCMIETSMGYPQYVPGVGESFELAQRQWGGTLAESVAAAAQGKGKVLKM